MRKSKKSTKCCLLFLLVMLVETVFLVAYIHHNQKEVDNKNLQIDQQLALISEKNELIENQDNKIAYYEEKEKKSQIVSKHGMLKVINGKVVSEDDELFQLKGVSTHGLTWYPLYINAGAIRTIKNMGANVIRLAMYTDQNGSYIENPEDNRMLVYMGIENAINEDLYVIVDWHVLRDENPLKYMEEAIDFFEEISAHYGNCPNIIYEICNEPNHGTTWEDISQYANEIIPRIRKNAKDAIVIVGTPNYDKDLQYALEDPLKYDNILYSYHKYIDLTGEKHYNIDILKEAIGSGLPVFVSEWGISHDDIYNFDKPNEFLEYLENESIGWCVWSLSNKNEDYSIISADCDKYSDWQDIDLTEVGKFYAQWLSR